MTWTRRSWINSCAAAAFCGAPTQPTRLADARTRTQPLLVEAFERCGLSYPASTVFLRAFKHERSLELWAANHRDDPHVLVATYPFCAASGTLGPKRRQGDFQVPEGVYAIDLYNPRSAYHLSMRVSYPNPSDRIRGDQSDLGGAIMIHGSCVSIGCIAIRDAPIEEVFLSAYDCRSRHRAHVPIHIFPLRFDPDGWRMLEREAGENFGLLAFWRELEPIYRVFEATHRVPKVAIDRTNGAYSLVHASS